MSLTAPVTIQASADDQVGARSGARDRLVRVSVVITNYNYGRFLRQAIDSALRQTYPDVEVIVVDDGSTDDSRDVIASYGAQIQPVLKPNGGQASAFNAGFERCHGDVVIFLDADHMLLPDTAERVSAAFRASPELAKICYRLEIADDGGVPTGAFTPARPLSVRYGDLRQDVLEFPDEIPWPPTSGNAFSTVVLRKVFPIPENAYRICADYYLSNVTPLFGPVSSFAEPGALYCVHSASCHNTRPQDIRQTRRIITLTKRTHHDVLRYARQLGIQCGDADDSAPRSVSYCAHRVISLRLDPEHHPIRDDTRMGLLKEGTSAALGRYDLPLAMRCAWAVWMVVAALGPTSAVAWLAGIAFGARMDDEGVQAARAPRPPSRLPRPIRGYLDSRRAGLGQARTPTASLRWVAVGSTHLVAMLVVTSALGYLFWIAAARLFNPSVVGLTSAAVSTVFLISEIGNFGMGLGAAYVLPDARERWGRMVNAIMLAVGGFALLSSLVVLAVAGALPLGFGGIEGKPGFLPAFAATSTIWVIAYVLDQILTIEDATRLVMLRNGLGSVVRLLALPFLLLMPSLDPVIGLLSIWGVSASLSVAVAVVMFARQNLAGRRLTWRIDSRAIVEVLPLSITNHVLTTVEWAPRLVLPLIVLAALSPEANAYFYTSWIVAVILYQIPASVTRVLFARGAAAERLTNAAVLRVLAVTVSVVAPLSAAVALLRDPLLSVFGADYARNSSDLLALLALAAIPVSVSNIYIIAERLRRSFSRAFLFSLAIAVLSLGGVSLTLGRYGLLSIGTVMLASYSAISVVCIFLMFHTSPTHGREQSECDGQSE